jgi:hypothetical protein
MLARNLPNGAAQPLPKGGNLAVFVIKSRVAQKGVGFRRHTRVLLTLFGQSPPA